MSRFGSEISRLWIEGIHQDAIAYFQREHALTPSRTLDADTKDAILAAHDEGEPRPAPTGAPL